MDIYSFLNSKDIAEHCRSLQKTWTPLQMALIISRSDRSVPDKHRAWQELISDYPDMTVPPLPECEITNGFESLHKMLLAQIDYEERVLRSFREQISPYEFAGPYDPEITYFFENMCCTDIPVPFQLGDVLTIPEKSKREENQIFVLRPLNEKAKKRYAKWKELPYYEYLDINSNWGYLVSDGGILYGNHIDGAERFEYYRGIYEGPARLLHYVSLYLKGKLDLLEILTMQCRIFLESQLDQELDYQNHGCFIADDLLAENQLAEKVEERA